MTPLKKTKTTNPFRKSGGITQIDGKHYEENYRGKKILTINRNIKRKRKLVKQNMIIIPAQPQTIKIIQHNLMIFHNLYYTLYYYV